jgi:murein DD-endopeptidase MepM/ murein hydrolase activator NlpD
MSKIAFRRMGTVTLFGGSAPAFATSDLAKKVTVSVLTAMVLGATLFLSFALSLETDGSQDEPLSLTHKQRSLQPGEVILFESESSRPLKQMLLKAFSREFPAFSEDGGLNWTALVGIDLDTKPGRYAVELFGIDRDGKNLAGSSVLTVAAKKFPTRRLTVEEKYVSPPADVLVRIKAERERVNGIFAATAHERLWQGPFLLPVPGSVISAFGKRSVYNGRPRSPHAGVDFRGAAGTPIQAPNAGIVVLAANLYYSGNTVILDHGLGLYSYLGHMSNFSVREGDRVKTGDIVGKVGATGVVTGPHLHWTVRLITSRIDPLSLVYLFGK